MQRIFINIFINLTNFHKSYKYYNFFIYFTKINIYLSNGKEFVFLLILDQNHHNHLIERENQVLAILRIEDLGLDRIRREDTKVIDQKKVFNLDFS